MIYSSFEKWLLKKLYSSKSSHNIYDLHIKYNYSPAQFSRFVNKFTTNNVVEIDSENSISLTDIGKEWILANRKSIFLKSKKQKWVDIPEDWRLL